MSNTKCFLFMLIISIAVTIVGVGSNIVCAADKLYEDFCDPPAQARPFVRWWWNGNCVTEKEILRELDVMKEAGIGGVEINPLAMPEWSAETGAKSLKWLSPEWNRMVKVATDGARQRGMIADLIVGTGWPFGGRFLESGQTIQGVGLKRKRLRGPGVFSDNIDKLMVPPKTLYKVEDMPKPVLLFLRLVPQKVSEFQAGIDLLDKVGADGSVQFDIPAGEHILYIGSLRESFTAVVWGAPGADGPVLDHYNKAAVEKYLNRMSESLGPALGGKLGDGLRAMFCDSIELSGANWTSDIMKEFERRRGYRPEPYLPFVLTEPGREHRGYSDEPWPADSGFVDTVRRARYDFNKTLVELFHERFIHTFSQWCRHNGVMSRYQAYGTPFLMGMMDGYLVPDIPEGDTWLFYHPIARETLDNIRYAVWNKYASSGAHLADRRLVGCESMTNATRGRGGGVFRATLEYIKQADDLNFVTGVNHSILHGFNYSPPEAGFPGWVRYGTYFSEQNPWWRYFRRWADYNARLSAVFQSTRPVVEVAILGPTADAWSRKGLARRAFIDEPRYLHQLWQAVSQNGCSADYISEAVLQRAEFDGGKLRYGPMSYEILMLADVNTLEPDSAKAIERYAGAGGKIVFIDSVPERSASLVDAARNDRIVRKSVKAALETGGSRVALTDGPGKDNLIEWVGATLGRFGVEPAVRISKPDSRLFQIHHKLNERDVFFFANPEREGSRDFTASFSTGEKTPWRWDAETGERAVFAYGERKDNLAIHLEPLESLLLVFEPDMCGEQNSRYPAVDEKDFIEIKGPWKLTLRAAQGGVIERSLNELADFGKSDDEQLSTFAGTAIYHTPFEVTNLQRAYLDLGGVYDVSQVSINGRALGVRWWGRHLYDAGGALRRGRNILEVKVATVLSNYCLSLEDNAAAQVWTRGRKKVSAGLVGPVRLLAGRNY